MNTDLVVLQFVHDYQKLCGGRTPSIRLIAKGISEGAEVSLSHQTVFNALDRLEKIGYIERKPFTAPTKVRDITILEDGEIALRMNKPRNPEGDNTLLDQSPSLGAEG